MIGDLEKFKEYLNENSLKQTSERIDIAKAVSLFEDTFTVDELMDKINEYGWPVSKATLYRSLPLLIESGMIKPIATHQLNNHTFKKCGNPDTTPKVDCDKCGNTAFVNESIQRVFNQNLIDKYDIEDIINNLFILKGVCPDCKVHSQIDDLDKNLDNPVSDIRILLFEDEELYNSYMVEFLEEHGMEVFSFNNPTEFNLDCSCNEEKNTVCADIIISDIKMPGINGIDFIKKQIEKNCRIKNIAFISAYWTLEDLDYAGSIGAAIFHKPFDIFELKAWIDNCIQEIQEERAFGTEFIKEESA